MSELSVSVTDDSRKDEVADHGLYSVETANLQTKVKSTE